MSEAVTDGGTERVPLGDWEALADALERFAGPEAVERDGATLSARMGSAHVTLSRDGTVSTGMPLHDFETDAAESLVFDFDTGSLRVITPDIDYEFRRP